ncbi:hypothetical protein, partial [Staphylococcus aureus]|uniref:hypothetical protein n=1 Tax=Staphylococcus aureus TaxID=1280 RepID=UPI001C930914
PLINPIQHKDQLKQTLNFTHPHPQKQTAYNHPVTPTKTLLHKTPRTNQNKPPLQQPLQPLNTPKTPLNPHPPLNQPNNT